MTEARITCTCANIAVADLGIRMTKGDIVYLPEAAARKSKDLMVAARAGGVAVHFVQRAREIRQPTAVVGRPKRTLTPIVPGPRPEPIAVPDLRMPEQPLDDIVADMEAALAAPPDPPEADNAKLRKKKRT